MLRHFCLWRGILLPIGLVAIGCVCLWTQTAWIYGRGGGRAGWLILPGVAGTVQGLMFIFWGIGFHLHHGWRNIAKLEVPAHFLGLGAYIAAAGLGLYLLFLFASHVLA